MYNNIGWFTINLQTIKNISDQVKKPDLLDG